jgi:hypothetical protein
MTEDYAMIAALRNGVGAVKNRTIGNSTGKSTGELAK